MEATPFAATARAPAFEQDVKAELVRYLYRQAPGSMVAILVVACILAYVLWNRVPNTQLLAWLRVLAGVCVLRMVQIRSFFRQEPPAQRMSRWAVASAAGSALIGAVWAFASILFLDPDQPISVITITVILMGICAGSIVNLASYLPSFWVVVGPSMGALMAVLLWHGNAVSNTVALLAGVALIAYFVGARNVHRLLTESLQLSFENVALRREAEEKSKLLETALQQMDAARRSAEQANAAKTRFLAAASHDLRQPITQRAGVGTGDDPPEFALGPLCPLHQLTPRFAERERIDRLTISRRQRADPGPGRQRLQRRAAGDGSDDSWHDGEAPPDADPDHHGHDHQDDRRSGEHRRTRARHRPSV
jgi:signal transduction histidine kinase